MTMGRFIGRTRYVVLIAVVAVMLISLTLFILGALDALSVIVKAWREAFTHGEFASTDLLIEILGVIVTPLNLTAALGVESLIDLETKVISVVIVILAVAFREHFVRWEEAAETLHFAGARAVVFAALVVFPWSHRLAKEFAKTHRPAVQARSQRALVEGKREEEAIGADEAREPVSTPEREA